MNAEKTDKLKIIVRQFRDVAKVFIDSCFDFAEKVLTVLSDTETDSIKSEGLIERSELARQLGISARTISNLEKKGLPVIRFSPRCVRYDLQEVKAWLLHRKPNKDRVRVKAVSLNNGKLKGETKWQ